MRCLSCLYLQPGVASDYSLDGKPTFKETEIEKNMCNNFFSGVNTLKHNPAPHRDGKLFFCGGNYLLT